MQTCIADRRPITPPRITLSRANGWRLQEVAPGAVVVRRPTDWGNPFIVGRHGTVAECVARYARLALGYIDAGTRHVDPDEQVRLAKHIRDNIGDLKGLPLACTCRQGNPCHARVLIILANQRPDEAERALHRMIRNIDLPPAILMHIDDLERGAA